MFLEFVMHKVVNPDDVGGGALVVPRLESAPNSSKHRINGTQSKSADDDLFSHRN